MCLEDGPLMSKNERPSRTDINISAEADAEDVILEVYNDSRYLFIFHNPQRLPITRIHV